MDDNKCKYKKRLYNIGQYWCLNNHDMIHCDTNCPFREEEDNTSIFHPSSSSQLPHNIYKS